MAVLSLSLVYAVVYVAVFIVALVLFWLTFFDWYVATEDILEDDTSVFDDFSSCCFKVLHILNIMVGLMEF